MFADVSVGVIAVKLGGVESGITKEYTLSLPSTESRLLSQKLSAKSLMKSLFPPIIYASLTLHSFGIFQSKILDPDLNLKNYKFHYH